MTHDACDRRTFAGLLAGTSAAALASGSAAADDKDKPQERKPADDACPDLDDFRLEALVAESVRRLYPHENLTPEIMDRIRGEIRINLIRSRILSSVPLDNSDEPAFVFSAWRADG